MKKRRATVLLNQNLSISERYRVELKVFDVVRSEKFPEGIKVRFVLLDEFQKKPRLLVDNHAPFGFHVHDELPGNRHSRRLLKTKDYVCALEEFWRLVERILNEENESFKNNF